MARLILKGGTVVDPASGVQKVTSLVVENGKIAYVGDDADLRGAEVIDVTGKIVAPGLVDVHCHLRDPGFTQREDFRSGTRAAAVGGFTTLLAMPNTDPVCDSPGVVEYVISKSKREGIVNVLPYGSITKGERGEELSPMRELADAGAVAFSDDGQPIMNGGLMRQALQEADAIGKLLAVHCEDRTITGNGVMNEGPVARRWGLEGIPYTSEAVMVARDILLAEETGSLVHICHVGCARSVELIREAKRRGIKVSAEVIPHYLNLTDEDMVPGDANFKIKPPIGSKRDREALKDGLADGTIDVIATDHAPYTPEEKARRFEAAPFGLVGLETALAVVLTELVHGGVMSLSAALEKMTAGPARLFGLDKGSLAVGNDADIVVIDPDKEWVVDSSRYQSKSRNCPQHGRRLKGKAVLTMVGGKIVMRDGKVIV